MITNYRKIVPILASIIIILTSIGMVFFLVEPHLIGLDSPALTHQQEQPVNSAPVTIEEATLPEASLNLRDLLATYRPTDVQAAQSIRDYSDTHYQADLLASQAEIVRAIDANKLDTEELGYLFLPEHPATLAQLSDIPQIDIPLYLQKDGEWRRTQYGSNTTRQLGENGCAILSLAMIQATLEDREVHPDEVLEWSQNRYYVHNQGTSWNIFHEFAQEHGYQFYNFGNHFYEAMAAVNEGQPIIASVSPGMFTEFGHIIVIRGYHDGKVYVNDPNDDPDKMFSIQGIDEEILLNEGTNYWAIY